MEKKRAHPLEHMAHQAEHHFSMEGEKNVFQERDKKEVVTNFTYLPKVKLTLPNTTQKAFLLGSSRVYREYVMPTLMETIMPNISNNTDDTEAPNSTENPQNQSFRDAEGEDETEGGDEMGEKQKIPLYLQDDAFFTTPNISSQLTPGYMRAEACVVLKFFSQETWAKLFLRNNNGEKNNNNNFFSVFSEDSTPAFSLCSAPALYTVDLVGPTIDAVNTVIEFKYQTTRIIPVIIQCSSIPVSFDISVEMNNIDGLGSSVDYVFSAVYFCFVGVYICLFLYFLGTVAYAGSQVSLGGHYAQRMQYQIDEEVGKQSNALQQLIQMKSKSWMRMGARQPPQRASHQKNEPHETERAGAGGERYMVELSDFSRNANPPLRALSSSGRKDRSNTYAMHQEQSLEGWNHLDEDQRWDSEARKNHCVVKGPSGSNREEEEQEEAEPSRNRAKREISQRAAEHRRELHRIHRSRTSLSSDADASDPAPSDREESHLARGHSSGRSSPVRRSRVPRESFPPYLPRGGDNEEKGEGGFLNCGEEDVDDRLGVRKARSENKMGRGLGKSTSERRRGSSSDSPHSSRHSTRLPLSLASFPTREDRGDRTRGEEDNPVGMAPSHLHHDGNDLMNRSNTNSGICDVIVDSFVNFGKSVVQGGRVLIGRDNSPHKVEQLMYPPLKWVLFILIPIKCMWVIFCATNYSLLSRDQVPSVALTFISTVLSRASNIGVIGLEILVSMGWGLAVEKLPLLRVALVLFLSGLRLTIDSMSYDCLQENVFVLTPLPPHIGTRCVVVPMVSLFYSFCVHLFCVIQLLFIRGRVERRAFTNFVPHSFRSALLRRTSSNGGGGSRPGKRDEDNTLSGGSLRERSTPLSSPNDEPIPMDESDTTTSSFCSSSLEFSMEEDGLPPSRHRPPAAAAHSTGVRGGNVSPPSHSAQDAMRRRANTSSTLPKGSAHHSSHTPTPTTTTPMSRNNETGTKPNLRRRTPTSSNPPPGNQTRASKSRRRDRREAKGRTTPHRSSRLRHHEIRRTPRTQSPQKISCTSSAQAGFESEAQLRASKYREEEVAEEEEVIYHHDNRLCPSTSLWRVPLRPPPLPRLPPFPLPPPRCREEATIVQNFAVKVNQKIIATATEAYRVCYSQHWLSIFCTYDAMMWPFIMVIFWPVALLCCSLSMYDTGESYMVVCFREIEELYTLIVIVYFLGKR